MKRRDHGRHSGIAAAALSCVLVTATACTSSPATSNPTSTGAATASSTRTATSAAGAVQSRPAGNDGAQARAIEDVVRTEMARQHLRAAIVKVTIDGKPVLTKAWGDSMPGVPATTDMHFRNGAVSIAYMSTLLLELVDEHKVTLEDKVSKWLPDVKYSDQVTLGQLAQMTAGYVDYVKEGSLDAVQYADPFADISTQQRIRWSTQHDLVYRPGTNWNYSHTDYVILGMALEKITGEPLAQALQRKVLGPLHLRDTADPGTPAIPEPVLHAYTSERRYELGIPDSKPFMEDSTFWNPSWTLAKGAIEYTNIDDLNATAIAIGTGKLLSRASYEAMTTKDLIGRTTLVDDCTTCFPQAPQYTYGLGLVSSGNWLMQNPLFAGEAGAFAYLPSRKVAIAVTTTFLPGAYTSPSSPRNAADTLWRKIGQVLVPAEDAPPIRPGS